LKVVVVFFVGRLLSLLVRPVSDVRLVSRPWSSDEFRFLLGEVDELPVGGRRG
jgi:hypothetical protein